VVNQVIAPGHVQMGIGEKRKGIASFLNQFVGLFRRVNADCNRTYTRGLELRELFLYASQLEVAERSPVAAIKDQQRRFRLRGPDRRGKQLCQ